MTQATTPLTTTAPITSSALLAAPPIDSPAKPATPVLATLASPDPYITYGGTTFRFLSDCTGLTNCLQSTAPIQAAVDYFSKHTSDIAPADRTIYVDPGTYNEDVAIRGLTSLSLRGTSGSNKPVINGSVSIVNSMGIDFSQFVVQNGILVDHSANVTVSNVVASNAPGKPGIQINQGNQVTLSNVSSDNGIRVDNSREVSVNGSADNHSMNITVTAVANLTVNGGPGDDAVAVNATHLTGLTTIDGGTGTLYLSGLIDASDILPGGTGGTVNVLGERIVLEQMVIDVSGDAGGGTTLIGGDYQGKGTVPNSSYVTVSHDSTIKADAIAQGNGGKVIVWSDQATQFDGSISARGGNISGNGGFIEVSGKTVSFQGVIDTRAPHGFTGMFLLDPTNYTIAATGGDETGASVAASLATTNRTISADDTITVNDPVNWASGNALTLNAKNILVNANLISAGGGNITLAATAHEFLVDDKTASASITVNNATLQGGDIVITADSNTHVIFDSNGAAAQFFGGILSFLANIRPFVGISRVEADATVALTGATKIISSGNVTVTAHADSESQIETLGVAASVAYGKSVANATVTLGSQVSITATKDVTLASSTLNTVAVSAIEGGLTPSIPVDLVFAGAEAYSTTTTTVSQDATINGQNVNVTATNIKNFSLTASGGGGTSLLGAAVAWSKSDSNATADTSGKITARGNVVVNAVADDEKNTTTASSVIGDGFWGPVSDPIAAKISAQGPIKWASDAATKFMDQLATKYPSIFGPGDPNDKWKQLGISAAVVVAEHSNTATAKIGSTGVVKADGSVTVSSMVTNSMKLAATALYLDCTYPDKATCPDQKKKVAISGGVIVANIDNHAFASVEPNGVVDAKQDVTVAATTTVPYQLTWFDFITGPTMTDKLTSVWGKLNQNVGLQDGVFSSWAQSASDAKEVGIAGSVSIFNFTTETKAYIGANAKINQDLAYRTANQNVGVTANGEVQTMNMSGVVGPILKKINLPNNPFGTNGGGSAGIGGAVLIMYYDNTTEARIDAGALVYSKDLTVHADMAIMDVSIAVAGGKAGTLGFSGSFSYVRVRNETFAQIASGAQITATGKIDLHAQDNVFVLNGVGGVVASENVGIGVSVAVNDIVRNTSAFIGTAADKPLSPDLVKISAAGAITIEAKNTGNSWVFALAAAVVTPPDPSKLPNTPTPDDPLTGVPQPMGAAQPLPNQIAISFAGDAAVNLVTDTTLAYINANGSVSSGGLLSIPSTNDTNVVDLSGSVAITFAGATNSAGIAGSVSVAQLDSTTKSFIAYATVKANTLSMTATRGGFFGSLSAGGSGAPLKDGVAIAGSVSVNRILVDTETYVYSATVTLQGDSSLEAHDETQIWSIAGALGYGGKAGIGVAVGVNLIGTPSQPATTRAYIQSSPVTVTGGKLQVSALRDNPTVDPSIIAITGAGGVSVGASSGAGTGMVSVNIIHSVTEAYLKDSTVTDGATAPALNVTVTATDKPLIVSIGGAVGVSTGNFGVGAAVGYNEIDSTTRAYLDHAVLTITGTLTVQAETDAKLTGGMIGVGGTSGVGIAGAGSASVNKIKNTIDAHIVNKSNAVAGGAIAITAIDNPLIVSVAGGVAGAGTGAAGAAVSYNLVQDVVTAYIDDSTVNSTGSTVSQSANSTALLITLAVGGARAEEFALGGAVTVNSIGNSVDSHIANGSTVTANSDIGVTAYEASTLYAVSGGIAVVSGGAAIGAAVSYNFVGGAFDPDNPNTIDRTTTATDSITAYIDNSDVNAGGNLNVAAGFQAMAVLPNPASVDLGVTTVLLPEQITNQITTIAVGGSGGTAFSLGGAAVINFIRTTVDARITNLANLQTVQAVGTLSVLANDGSQLNSGAGGVGIVPSGSAIGAAVSYNEIKNTIRARVGSVNSTTVVGANTGTVWADRIVISATSTSNVYNTTFAGAGAESFAVGGSVSVNRLGNTIDAHIANSSHVSTSSGDIVLLAEDMSTISSLSGQIAASGNVGAGAALAYNEISNNIWAYVYGSTLVANSGSVSIEADSTKASLDANIETIAAGIAGGATAAVAGSAAANLITNDTEAYIAKSTVTADNNVTLFATSDISITAYGGTVSGSLAVGIGGTVLVNLITNKTLAYIISDSNVVAKGKGDTVTIKKWTTNANGRDVHETEAIKGLAVIADDNEYISAVGITAGFALPKGVVGPPSVGIGVNIIFNKVNDDTEAYIDDSLINNATDHGQSVKVKAHQSTYIESGGLSIGGGDVGVGAVVDTDIISNTTKAYISDSDAPADRTTVYAGPGGIEVSARSWEKVKSLVGGAGAGTWVGAAGAASAVKLTNDTEAYISESDLHSDAALSVIAYDRAEIDFFVGTVAGSVGVGAGGSVAVGLVSDMTKAFMIGAVTTSAGNTLVQADSTVTLPEVYLGTGGGGGIAVAGAVAVFSISDMTFAYIGDNLRSSNVTTTAVGKVSVLASDSVTITADTLGAVTLSAGASIGATIEVITIKDTVDAHIGANTQVTADGDVKVEATATRSVHSRAVAVSASAGVGIAGVVSVVNIGTGLDQEGANQASPVQQSLNNTTLPAGGISGIGSKDDTGKKAKTAADASLFTVSLAKDSSAVLGSTTAYIGTNAWVTSNGKITVHAIETLTQVDVRIGSGAAGAGFSAAGSVLIVNLSSVVSAYVANAATLSAVGNISVKSAYINNNLIGVAAGGSGSFTAALGAQVVIVTDNGSSSAYVGDSSSATPAKIIQANNITVDAETSRSLYLAAKGVSVGTVAAGAAVARATIGGSTNAYLYSNTQVGQQAGKTVASLTITANSVDSAEIDMLSVAVGIGAGSGNDAKATLNPTINATMGNGSLVTVSGAISLGATETPQAKSNGVGVNAGALTVGVSLVRADITANVTAAVGANSSLKAATLTIGATLALPASGDTAHGEAFAASGSLIGVNATESHATTTANVQAYAGDNSTLDVSGVAQLTATTNSRQYSKATAKFGAIIAAGSNRSFAESNTTTFAWLGNGVKATGGTLSLLATGTDDNYAEAVSGSGGIVSGAAASAYTTSTSNTQAYTGSGSSTRPIDVTSFILKAEHTNKFNGSVDTVNASILGGSGAYATHVVFSTVSATIGASGYVQATSITINTVNTTLKDWLGATNGDDATPNLTSGSGGVTDSPSVESTSSIKQTANATVGDNSTVHAVGNATLTLDATNNITARDKARLNSGGLIAVASSISHVWVETSDANVVIGTNAKVTSDSGDIKAGTRNTANLEAHASADAYGVAGAPSGEGWARFVGSTNLTVNAGADVKADNGAIQLAAGESTDGTQSQISAVGIVRLWNKTAFPINSDPGAFGDVFSQATLTVATGGTVESAGDIGLVANRGIVTVKGDGVGKDLYRAAAAAIASGISNLFGGGDVSFDIKSGSTEDLGAGVVVVNGTALTGIHRLEALTLDATIPNPNDTLPNGLVKWTLNPTTQTNGMTYWVEYGVSIAKSLRDRIQRLRDLQSKYAGDGTAVAAYGAEIGFLEQKLIDLGLATRDITGTLISGTSTGPSAKQDALNTIELDQVQISGKQSVIDQKNAIISSNTVTITNNTGTINTNNTTITNNTNTINTNNTTITNNTTTINTNNTTVASNNTQISTLTTDRNTTQTKLTAIPNCAVDTATQATCNSYQATINSDNNQITTLQASNSSLSNTNTTLQASNSSLSNTNTTLQASNSSLSSTNTTLTTQNTTLSTQNTQLTTDISNINADNANLQNKINALQSQIDNNQLSDTTPNGPTADYVHVNNVLVRLGNIRIKADNLNGSGNLAAPGDAKITIVNNTPAYLVIQNLKIASDDGGRITLNGIEIMATDSAGASSEINRINKTGSGAALSAFSSRDTTGGGFPEISIQSNYDPNNAKYANLKAPAPDIQLTGEIWNLRGNVIVHSAAGSINVLETANIRAGTVDIQAMNGDFVQSYVDNFFNVGGDAGSLFSDPNLTPKGIVANGTVYIAARFLNINGLIQSGIAQWNLTLLESPMLTGSAGSLGVNGTTMATDRTNYLNDKAKNLTPAPDPYVFYTNDAGITIDYNRELDRLELNLTRAIADFSTAAGKARNADGLYSLVQNGTDNIGANYDAANDRYVVNGTEVKGGLIQLFGQIINTGHVVISTTLAAGFTTLSNTGRLKVLDGYGAIQITNPTGRDVVLGNLNTGSGIAGKIDIMDLQFTAPVSDTVHHYFVQTPYFIHTVITRLNGQVFAAQTGAWTFDANGLPNADSTFITSSTTAYTYAPAYVPAGSASQDKSVKTDANGVYYAPQPGLRFNWTTGVDQSTITYYHYTGTQFFGDASLAAFEDTAHTVAGPVTLKSYRMADGDYLLRRQPLSDPAYKTYATRISNGTPVKSVTNDVTNCNWWTLCIAQDHTVDWNVTTPTKVVTNHTVSATWPIYIEFMGSTTGTVVVDSAGNVILKGTISNKTGNTTINSTANSILQGTDDALTASKDVNLTAAGSVGSQTAPIKVQVGSGWLNTKAWAGDVWVNQVVGDLNLGLITAPNGLVELTSDGSMLPGAGAGELVQGLRIELTSTNGTLGNNGTPLTIQSGYTAVWPQVTYGLKASARGDINILNQAWMGNPNGDLLVDSVVSLGGDVRLETVGLMLDNNPFEQVDIKAWSVLLSFWQKLRLVGGDPANATKLVEEQQAYENSRTQDYQTYWAIRNSRCGGNDCGVNFHYTATATEMQVLQSQGVSVATFEINRTAEYNRIRNEGAGTWNNGTFTTTFTYAATNAELYGDGKNGNPLGILHASSWTTRELGISISPGLIKEVTDTNPVIKEPNVKGNHVTLIGNTGIGTTVLLASIATATLPENLTDEQKVALASAERSDATITAGFITILRRKPINVEVGATGNLIATVPVGNAYIASLKTVGLAMIDVADEVRIKVKESILNANVNPAPNNWDIQSGNVILEAAHGSIGTTNNPITVQLKTGATVIARAEQNINIAELVGQLNVDTIYSPKDVNLTATGSIVEAYNDAAVKVESRSLTLKSGGSVGGSGIQFFDIQLSNKGLLEATAPNDVYVRDVGNLNVGNVSLANASVNVCATRGIAVVLGKQVSANTSVVLQAGQCDASDTVVDATVDISGTIMGQTVQINGQAGNDTINVNGPSNILANTVTLTGNDGNDTINIQVVKSPMTVNGGVGSDRINVSSDAPTNTGTLDNIHAALTINGGTNDPTGDTLNVSDAGNANPQNGTLTPNTIPGLFGAGGSIDYHTIENLNLSLGSGGNTFTIPSTNPGTTNTLNAGAGRDIVNVQAISGPTTINGGTGDDTINVSSDAPTNLGMLSGIAAPLTVNGGDGNNTLNMSDAGDAAPNTGTLTATMLAGLGMTNGIAYGTIETLNITLGNAPASTLNTFNVQSTASIAVTTVNGGFGDETFNVGDASNSLDQINGALILNGNASSVGNLLNLNDQGDGDGNTYDITSTTIDRTGAARITYSALEQLMVNSGVGNDTFSVASTHTGATVLNANAGVDTINVQTISGATTVNAGMGNDIINVSSDAPTNLGTLSGIAALLTVNGGDGNNTLNVSDIGDATPSIGTLTANTIIGLFGAGGSIVYHTIENLVLSLGSGGNTFTIPSTNPGTTNTLNAGAGRDIVNVQAISGPTTINGGTGDDTINVSSDAPTNLGTLSGIAAPLTVSGGANFDTLNVSDAGNALPASIVMTGSGLSGSLFGAGGNLAYGGLESFNLQFGSGGNTITVVSTGLGTTTLNTGSGNDTVNVQTISGLTIVNAQGGSDVINLSSDAPVNNGVLGGITALLIVNGGDGNNTLNVSDGGNLAGSTGTLGATGLSGTMFGAGGSLTFSGIANFNMEFGGGSDHLNVNAFGTGFPALLDLSMGNGDDQVTIQLGNPPAPTQINIDGDAPSCCSDWLILNGTSGNETFNIADAGTFFRGWYLHGPVVTVGATQVGMGGIEDLLVHGGAGQDVINVEPSGYTTLHLDGSGGDSTLNFNGDGLGVFFWPGWFGAYGRQQVYHTGFAHIVVFAALGARPSIRNLLGLIPVTGGEWVSLCGNRPATLRLPDGNQVQFDAGCPDQASVTPVDTTEFLGPLPAGMELVSMVLVRVIRDGTGLEQLAPGETMVVAFVVPPGYSAQLFMILWWDPTLNDGAGGWVVMPTTITADGRLIAVTNRPGYFVFVLNRIP